MGVCPTRSTGSALSGGTHKPAGVGIKGTPLSYSTGEAATPRRRGYSWYPFWFRADGWPRLDMPALRAHLQQRQGGSRERGCTAHAEI